MSRLGYDDGAVFVSLRANLPLWPVRRNEKPKFRQRRGGAPPRQLGDFILSWSALFKSGWADAANM